MMDSPGQRTLRIATDITVLFLVNSIYVAYLDGGLASLLWRLGTVVILQRALVSMKKQLTQDDPVPSAAPSVVRTPTATKPLESFFGSALVDPSLHQTAAHRWYRAVSLMVFPLFMHCFIYFGYPINNPVTPAANIGSIATRFQVDAAQRDAARAGDSPLALLRWESAQSTKFWSFTAGPELCSMCKLVALDVLSVFLLFVVLSLLYSASGGSLSCDWFVRVTPLIEKDERSDEEDALS